MMANWCFNDVLFEGEYLLILQIKELFKIMAEKEEQEKQGQLPDWIIADEGHFFDICWNESDKLTYQTKYASNIDHLVEIAKQYDCDFECEYQESGCQVYGKAIYIDGVLTDICLEAKDFEQFYFDENTDQHHFEGETYESESEILEILLERKFN